MANLLIKGVDLKTFCIGICPTLCSGDESECPVVELPPHGRLVDSDKLLIDIMDRNIDQAQFDDYSEFCHAIHNAPTVIEASKE